MEELMGYVRRPKPTYAKNRKSPHPQQQETKTVIEKAASHIQQQEASKIIPYLSTKMMVRSSSKREQQQWRNGHCSRLFLPGSKSHKVCVIIFFRDGSREKLESENHQRRQSQVRRAGARQKIAT
jgi:5-formyltetrahydrofolate cyclo-ligase